MDPKLIKWIRWLKSIEVEITQLVVARDIFWSVQKLIEGNKAIQKPSSFFKYMGDTYISFIVMGIRRQIKIDGKSISFARLLSEIECYPEKISRQYFRKLYKGSSVELLADNDFDQFCINSGDPYISSIIVRNDLMELRKMACLCEEFADKIIAHRDKRDPKILPTFKDADDTINFLDKLYVKYHLIFNAESMKSLMPVYQYDWKQIFDFPWRVKNKAKARLTAES
jgi:hypothetical protein